jgi:NAD+ kinase
MLVVVNPHRADAAHAGALVTRALEAEGIEVCREFDRNADSPIEAAVVLGGDGTILYAAAMTYGTGIPLLGVNLGHVGFLAELERDDVRHAIQRLVAGDYQVEERGTLEVHVTSPDGTTTSGWALNEATVERADLRRTVELAVEVDGKPVSTFGCDGVVVSTATGSTAHAFSAGGPILWPDVDALLFVPLAAHALFARPLVVGPASWFALEVTERSESDGQVVLDGSRSLEVPRGGRVEVRRGQYRVRLARMSDAPFTERLVKKFSLPINGWRGPVQDG